jgi:hypothetical protein
VHLDGIVSYLIYTPRKEHTIESNVDVPRKEHTIESNVDVPGISASSLLHVRCYFPHLSPPTPILLSSNYKNRKEIEKTGREETSEGRHEFGDSSFQSKKEILKSSEAKRRSQVSRPISFVCYVFLPLLDHRVRDGGIRILT